MFKKNPNPSEHFTATKPAECLQPIPAKKKAFGIGSASPTILSLSFASLRKQPLDMAKLPHVWGEGKKKKRQKNVFKSICAFIYIYKNKHLQSDTVLLCFQKHGSLTKDTNLAYYYHYYYSFLIILIILILCLSLNHTAFPFPLPSFSLVLDIYIYIKKKGFPTTNEFQLYLIIIMIINPTHPCV